MYCREREREREGQRERERERKREIERGTERERERENLDGGREIRRRLCLIFFEPPGPTTRGGETCTQMLTKLRANELWLGSCSCFDEVISKNG